MPDTTEDIHLGIVFNNKVLDKTAEDGVIDYAWGLSGYNPQPTSVHNTFYEAFDNTTGHNNDLAWFLANHPDWIEYRCDRTTVAYAEYASGHRLVPLDIANPEALQYMFDNFYAPAVINGGYEGVAFDDVFLVNRSWRVRCGHYDKTGNWVQQYTGQAVDPAFQQTVIYWAKWMYSHFHAIGATVSLNFSYDASVPELSDQLVENSDLILEEGAFGNVYGGFSYVDSKWVTRMNIYKSLAQKNKGLFIIDEMEGSFANISQADKQWFIANYLLIKGKHTYLTITGNQEYGYLFLTPEYDAPIGAAKDIMYKSQDVYMRDFTNGKAIVNPSSTQSYTVTLPSGVYKDLYGNSQNSITLGPRSGIVLLGSPDSTIVKYILTVTNGAGSGSYVQGASVSITADAPSANRVFDRWTGDTSYLTSPVSSTTTLTMPAKATALAATYRDIPSGRSGGSTVTSASSGSSSTATGASSPTTGSPAGSTSSDTSTAASSTAYSAGTLLKTAASNKVYVIIDNRKKWIPTPQVFTQLGYKWTEIKTLTDTELNAIPDYEDNLIRQNGDYRVYLVVNGVKRHIPNPQVFLNYGFDWNDIKDVDTSIISKYKDTYLIKEDGKEQVYYINPQGIRKHIPTEAIFNSYNDKWEDIQIISNHEMSYYPISNLIKLANTNDIYLLQGDLKRKISSPQAFAKYKLDWKLVTEVNQTEFDWYGAGGEMR